jgi:tetratricopeptide (TPR) repeat protein
VYNLAISLSSSLTVFLALWLSLPSDYKAWGIVLGLVVFFGLNYFLSKRIMNRMEALMTVVSKELQGQRFEKAIRLLQGGFELGKWQFFVKPQINAQIGCIYYLMREDEKAMESLKQGFAKHWVAMGMLAILYMKKKDMKTMEETFEKAVKASPKESLLWSVYAYCVLKEGGSRDKALDILSRGLKKLPDDEKLKANHTAVANKEKMKMKSYGEMWLQFYLEKAPPAGGQKIPPYMQALAQSGRGRKIIRR